MRKYDSYKKSTFEWMGEIPSHWILTKNRFGFQKYNNGKNESDDTPVLSLTTKGVKVKTNLSFGKSSESYIGHQLVEKGDIVFTPRDFDQTPILSDVSNYFGCISNLYIVDKTKEGVLNHFVNYYWYGLKYSVDYFKNFSFGMRYSFNRFQFDEIPLILPPLSEQQQIVSFLDTKTSQIDSLIEKTQRKIELLKEKRTSLINEVVTKGLNPNVEMKDSGVEWIGEIPSHWIVSKFNRFVFFQEGPGLRTFQFTDGGTKVICVTNITENGIDFTYKKFVSTEEYLEKYQHFTVEKGDLLLSSSGNSWGKISEYLYDERVMLNTSTIRLNTLDELKFNKTLIKLILKSEIVRKQLEVLMTGSCQPNFGPTHLNQLVIPVPPISEQHQIVSYLDEHTQLIGKTISIEEKRIELLKEYRQSLISEVVTGKIDVCQDNGIPWFQKPVPKVTIHKFETPINGREAIIGTIPPIWGEEVYKIVLNNLEVINSLYSSDIQFELIKKYLIPIGTNPQECYLIFKENVIFGIYYSIEYYQSRNEDYDTENEGCFFEILGTEIISTKFDQTPYWVFKELKKKGYTSFFKYYCKQNGLNDGGVMSFLEINEKIKNAKEVF
jgi:type I restriction enzyme S subunit